VRNFTGTHSCLHCVLYSTCLQVNKAVLKPNNGSQLPLWRWKLRNKQELKICLLVRGTMLLAHSSSSSAFLQVKDREVGVGKGTVGS